MSGRPHKKCWGSQHDGATARPLFSFDFVLSTSGRTRFFVCLTSFEVAALPEARKKKGVNGPAALRRAAGLSTHPFSGVIHAPRINSFFMTPTASSAGGRKPVQVLAADSPRIRFCPRPPGRLLPAGVFRRGHDLGGHLALPGHQAIGGGRSHFPYGRTCTLLQTPCRAAETPLAPSQTR